MTIADNIMNMFGVKIHKITPSADQNQWLKHLKTQLNEPTNQNLLKSLKPTNKKTL